jgi:hypothetical protein
VGKSSRRKKNRGEDRINLEPADGKISTRLGRLIAPHAAAGETRESYEALVALGAIAWNLSLFPMTDRGELIRDAVREAAQRGIPLTDQWLTALVDRKLRLFPSDDRLIRHFNVVLEPDGRFTLFVASLGPGK